MISLLHPSRGRPKQAYETANKWIERAGVEVEHILSIDMNDPSKWEYLNYKWQQVICHDNKSVVEATNRAAKVAKGDILVYLSDDFDCPELWGELVLKEFEDRPLLIKVDDCLQKFDVPVLTIPIMNRKLYEKMGYFFHPEYLSMFCDEQLFWKTRKLGALKMCPHLKFEHNHVSVGKAKDDETYRRSSRNWDHGKALFAKHKAEGFIS